MSERVADSLDMGQFALPILMPFERPVPPDGAKIAQVLRKYGLTGKHYLLNPNGISRAKHSDAIRDSIAILRNHPEFAEIVLASAGRERDRTAADNEAEAWGEMIYLGNVPHDELLCLMKAA